MSEEELVQSGMDAFNGGDYPAAVHVLGRALAILRGVEKPKELGLCLYYLESAEVFSEDREFQKEPIEEALELFRQTELHYLAASCCRCLAEIAGPGDLERAKRFLNRARTHYAQCDNWTGPASVSRLEAKLAIDRGNRDEALRLLDDATRLIDQQPQGLESVQAERRQIDKLKSGI